MAVLSLSAAASGRPAPPVFDRPQQTPPWLADVATALEGGPLHVASVKPGEAYYWPLLSRPFFVKSCPGVDVSEPWTLTVDVRFERQRTYHMTVLAGRLAENGNAYEPLLAAAKNRNCLLPKSGLSLLQIGSVWLAFPSVCSDIYPHRRSLPLVVAALQARLGARLPEGFILGGCGHYRLTGLANVTSFAASGQLNRTAR